jgi:hypothetical protein
MAPTVKLAFFNMASTVAYHGLTVLGWGGITALFSHTALIRHPSYLGLLILSLGWALAFRSGVGVLLAALLIPPLLARIHAEERLLGLSSAKNMMPIAPVPGGLYLGSIETTGRVDNSALCSHYLVCWRFFC